MMIRKTNRNHGTRTPIGQDAAAAMTSAAVREGARLRLLTSIVRAIIALAEAFNLQLVAEGVETEAAALTLLRHGCYRAQGFLLSHPLAGAQMEELLAAGRVPANSSPAPSV